MIEWARMQAAGDPLACNRMASCSGGVGVKPGRNRPEGAGRGGRCCPPGPGPGPDRIRTASKIRFAVGKPLNRFPPSVLPSYRGFDPAQQRPLCRRLRLMGLGQMVEHSRPVFRGRLPRRGGHGQNRQLPRSPGCARMRRVARSHPCRHLTSFGRPSRPSRKGHCRPWRFPEAPSAATSRIPNCCRSSQATCWLIGLSSTSRTRAPRMAARVVRAGTDESGLPLSGRSTPSRAQTVSWSRAWLTGLTRNPSTPAFSAAWTTSSRP